MDLGNYKTTKGADEGIWFRLDATTRIKIARAYTKKWAELYREKTKEYRYILDNDPAMMDEQVAAEIMAGIMAECVLLDWEGITEDGEVLPYSNENAYRILADPMYRDFAKMVDTMSKDASSFRETAVVKSEKKLESS